MRAVLTTIGDSKELQRCRTYLYYLGFLFIRAELGTQLSGLPGSPRKLSSIYTLGECLMPQGATSTISNLC